MRWQCRAISQGWRRHIVDSPLVRKPDDRSPSCTAAPTARIQAANAVDLPAPASEQSALAHRFRNDRQEELRDAQGA